MDQKTFHITPKGFLRTLSFIHLSMVGGLLVMGILFYRMNNDHIEIESVSQKDPMIVGLPVFALTCIFMGLFLFGKALKKLETEPSLKQKLAGYQSASLIRYAFIEAPAMLSIVWFNNTGNLLFLTIGGTLAIYLMALRPTKSKVVTDLQLKGAQLAQFNKIEEFLP